MTTVVRSDLVPSSSASPIEKAQLGSSTLATSLHFVQPNPGIVLEFIAQAESKIETLELWREKVCSDARLLLAYIKQERLDHAAQLKKLNNELKILQDKSTEAERVAYMTLVKLEGALHYHEIADIKVKEAEQKAEAAERRAEIAEDWLEKIQDFMTLEFSNEQREQNCSIQASCTAVWSTIK